MDEKLSFINMIEIVLGMLCFEHWIILDHDGNLIRQSELYDQIPSCISSVIQQDIHETISCESGKHFLVRKCHFHDDSYTLIAAKDVSDLVSTILKGIAETLRF